MTGEFGQRAPKAALPLALASARTTPFPALAGASAAAAVGPAARSERRLLGGRHRLRRVRGGARARDAEAFKGGMTVKEINAAFGERAGELKNPAKRVALIDMGLIHLFMM